MKPTAIITSFPRCRTAWLSAWLCGGACYAFHDGVCEGRSLLDVGQYLERMNARPEGHVVDVSSGLLMQRDHVRATACPIVWVERDSGECRRSYEDHMKGSGLENPAAWALIEQARNRFLQEFSQRITLKVSFSALSDIRVCSFIWDAVCPGEPFDEQRCRAFQRLNIQEIETWA